MEETYLQTARKLLIDCLGLKASETLIIVTDPSKRDIAEIVHEAGLSLGAESALMLMKERSKSGEEPPKQVAEAMKKADVCLCITKHSLTHTKARKEAAAAGVRLATMPGVTWDMFAEGAVTADYVQVKALTERVTAILTQGKHVRIVKDGKTLEFSIEKRSGVPSTGMYLNPGESGNLPSGEAYIAPVEGTARGEIVADGSAAGIGKLDSPLLLTVDRGRLTDASGAEADRLLRMLGDGDGRLLGEFGIGTNDKARITGIVLEDEKAFGTIHVAFGSNATFGGMVEAGVHIDLVVKEPDVYIDDALLMRQGKLVGV